MQGCSMGLAGLPPPKNLVFTVAAFPLFQGTPSEQAKGGKRRVWLLPLVPLSGDAKIISVAAHSTPGVLTPHFRQSITPSWRLSLCAWCWPANISRLQTRLLAREASAISVRPLQLLPA